MPITCTFFLFEYTPDVFSLVTTVIIYVAFSDVGFTTHAAGNAKVEKINIIHLFHGGHRFVSFW